MRIHRFLFVALVLAGMMAMLVHAQTAPPQQSPPKQQPLPPTVHPPMRSDDPAGSPASAQPLPDPQNIRRHTQENPSVEPTKPPQRGFPDSDTPDSRIPPISPTSGGVIREIDDASLLKPFHDSRDGGSRAKNGQDGDFQSRSTPAHMLPNQAQYKKEKNGKNSEMDRKRYEYQYANPIPDPMQTIALVEQIDRDLKRKASSINETPYPNGRHHYVKQTEGARPPKQLKNSDRENREPWNGGTRASQQKHEEYSRAQQRQHEKDEKARRSMDERKYADMERYEFEDTVDKRGMMDTTPDPHKGRDKHNSEFERKLRHERKRDKHYDEHAIGEAEDSPQPTGGDTRSVNKLKDDGHFHNYRGRDESEEEIKKHQYEYAMKHPRAHDEGKANKEPREDTYKHKSHKKHKHSNRENTHKKHHLNNLHEVTIVTPDMMPARQPASTLSPQQDGRSGLWVAMVCIGSVAGLMVIGSVLAYMLKRCNLAAKLSSTFRNPLQSRFSEYAYEPVRSSPAHQYGSTNGADDINYENFVADTQKSKKALFQQV